MARLLLINPNSSTTTTEMMTTIAASALPVGYTVIGATATAGPPMIINEQELASAAGEVLNTWMASGRDYDGVIISAFGDPGIDLVRQASDVPVVGIFEASMTEAGTYGRFGVATVTPELDQFIARNAALLGLADLYTGIRLTAGHPRELAADPKALEDEMAKAVAMCIEADGARAVVIGGGPLGQVAIQLESRFDIPVIAPIPAAVRKLLRLIGANRPAAG